MSSTKADVRGGVAWPGWSASIQAIALLAVVKWVAPDWLIVAVAVQTCYWFAWHRRRMIDPTMPSPRGSRTALFLASFALGGALQILIDPGHLVPAAVILGTVGRQALLSNQTPPSTKDILLGTLAMPSRLRGLDSIRPTREGSINDRPCYRSRSVSFSSPRHQSN